MRLTTQVKEIYSTLPTLFGWGKRLREIKISFQGIWLKLSCVYNLQFPENNFTSAFWREVFFLHADRTVRKDAIFEVGSGISEESFKFNCLLQSRYGGQVLVISPHRTHNLAEVPYFKSCKFINSAIGLVNVILAPYNQRSLNIYLHHNRNFSSMSKCWSSRREQNFVSLVSK